MLLAGLVSMLWITKWSWTTKTWGQWILNLSLRIKVPHTSDTSHEPHLPLTYWMEAMPHWQPILMVVDVNGEDVQGWESVTIGKVLFRGHMINAGHRVSSQSRSIGFTKTITGLLKTDYLSQTSISPVSETSSTPSQPSSLNDILKVFYSPPSTHLLWGRRCKNPWWRRSALLKILILLSHVLKEELDRSRSFNSSVAWPRSKCAFLHPQSSKLFSTIKTSLFWQPLTKRWIAYCSVSCSYDSVDTGSSDGLVICHSCFWDQPSQGHCFPLRVVIC
jgi:hypothetical protein